MPAKSSEIKAKSARYSRWFRVYTEVIDDPKTAQLSDRHGWGWVRLLAIAKRSDDGILPATGDIAFHLRCSRNDAENLVNDLIEIGLLDVIEGSANGSMIKPHNWDGRQFKWDGADRTNSKRQKRHRDRLKRSRNGRVTVEVTEVASVSVSEVAKLPYAGKASQDGEIARDGATSETLGARQVRDAEGVCEVLS